NLARFLNHSCSPNCEAQFDEEHIWFIAARDIKTGEELTFNYGFDLENYRHYPCRCGSSVCVGFMVAEEFFDHVRKQSRALETSQMDKARTLEQWEWVPAGSGCGIDAGFVIETFPRNTFPELNKTGPRTVSCWQSLSEGTPSTSFSSS